eukprot:TRINITY_DN13649_c0_g1_i2.p1 TRINITY_DN13649_c0_g1~~TRINITY_DN13649_c0_g1_i2.p1  ORF type:complete len:246 (-),score=90.37 TRINITY_DN13649_c0_g1_i2:143-829(-)
MGKQWYQRRVHDFVNVRTYYYALEHAQSEGINCKDLLTSQDKVEIIKATFEYIVAGTGLWAKGFCSSCYTSPLNHTSKLTENTMAFFALYRTVSDCFEANPDNNRTETKKSEACTQCAIDYNNLLTFYKQYFLRDQFPYLDGICFDILDAMNSTQHKWGTGHYHCGRELRGNLPLIGALLVVFDDTCGLLCVGEIWTWHRESSGESSCSETHQQFYKSSSGEHKCSSR